MPISIDNRGNSFIPKDEPIKAPTQSAGPFNTKNKLGVASDKNPKSLTGKVSDFSTNGSKHWKVGDVSQRLLTNQHESHLSLSNQQKKPKLLK